jgi:polar amino acid transport system ATP-binding protein
MARHPPASGGVLVSEAATVPVVHAVNVVKRYGEREVLRGVSLNVMPGQVVCVIGPSGSGKTTFLRCINHLEKIDGGMIEVNGELIGYRRNADGTLREDSEASIARQRQQIGFVFQRFNLWPHKRVIDNVIEGPVKVKGVPRPEAMATAERLLDQVGLLSRANDYPGRLSGGQQQRVAIARSLAMQPRLMLFDEPTSALDPETVGDVLDVIRDLAKGGMTMVIVTHEMGFARDAADQVVVFDEGLILESGPPDQVFGSPREARTGEFLSRVLR